MPDRQPGPLANVRVIDLTDDRAIYAGKLLADLGAEVTRIEPAEGDLLRRRAPFHTNGASLWHAYFASSRSILSEEPQTVAQLARSADVILDCERLPNPDALLEANPGLVIVDVTSFGRTGPWKDFQAPGLVAEALGGVAATSGDADTPPLKLYGDQYAFVGGAYAAIGALAALNHARRTGQGQIVRLSTHEALGTILEHVLMWAWYHEQVPFADGPVLHRQGSLHWSNAYVVMQATGGSIMITPTPDFSRQVAWLVEEGLGLELLDERFSDPANVAEMNQPDHDHAARLGRDQGSRAVLSRCPGPTSPLRLGDDHARSRRQSAAGSPRLVDALSRRRRDCRRTRSAIPLLRDSVADRQCGEPPSVPAGHLPPPVGGGRKWARSPLSPRVGGS